MDLLFVQFFSPISSIDNLDNKDPGAAFDSGPGAPLHLPGPSSFNPVQRDRKESRMREALAAPARPASTLRHLLGPADLPRPLIEELLDRALAFELGGDRVKHAALPRDIEAFDRTYRRKELDKYHVR